MGDPVTQTSPEGRRLGWAHRFIAQANQFDFVRAHGGHAGSQATLELVRLERAT
jgi:hypothetical protein